MKEIKSILALLVLVLGSFVLYKVFPAYWNNFKVNGMLSDAAITYTNFPKPDDDIKTIIAQKAQDFDVPIAPEQITVSHNHGDLTIAFSYTVHVDMPVYPFDLSFNDSTTNQNVMK
jgi:hypothetical protein